MLRDSSGWKAVIAEPKPGQQRVFLQGLTVSGTVKDAAGKPVAAVALAARNRERAVTTWADADGRFTFVGLDGGSWGVEVLDRAVATAEPLAVKVQETMAPLEVIVAPTVVLTGRVTGLPRVTAPPSRSTGVRP